MSVVNPFVRAYTTSFKHVGKDSKIKCRQNLSILVVLSLLTLVASWSPSKKLIKIIELRKGLTKLKIKVPFLNI
jgi:hypothetical protein